MSASGSAQSRQCALSCIFVGALRKIESETTYDTETTTVSDDDSNEETATVVEDDDPFSDKNRWRRGILEDPDADSW